MDLVFELCDCLNDPFSFIALDWLRYCENSSMYVIYDSSLRRKLLAVENISGGRARTSMTAHRSLADT